jgi:hypothetical protein
MPLPDYHGGSIVNLASSIEQALGGTNPYPALSLLDPTELDDVNNIFLVVIDGLGYNYFSRTFADHAIIGMLRGKITSVFPSTTAAAMTTLYTGVAPQNHGIMAWFTYFKELGMIGIMPPALMRGDKSPLFRGSVNPASVINVQSLFDRIDARGYILLPNDIVNKSYNNVVSGSGRQIGFDKFENLLARGKNLIKNNPGRKLVIAYWSAVDSISHEKGVASPEAEKEARAVLDALAGFAETSMPGLPGTKLVVTADHGLIDATPESIMALEAHPDLAATLSLPLCGEPRAVFCYVRPSRIEAFEAYVSDALGHACDAIPVDAAIAQEYFGLGEPNAHLFDRVGDYILVMKENYVLKDLLLGETRMPLIGHHGGTSDDEMFVPLFST